MSSPQYLSIQDTATVVMAATVLTSSYQYTTSAVGQTTPIDLASWQGVSVFLTVTTAESGKVCTMRIEWSQNGTDFISETVDVAGSVSGITLPFTPAQRLILIATDASGLVGYALRENRLARYVRIGVKGDGTTGAVKIQIQKLNN